MFNFEKLDVNQSFNEACSESPSLLSFCFLFQKPIGFHQKSFWFLAAFLLAFQSQVWREAIAFADTIYTVTKRFPDHEKFGLTSQMRRAAVSVSSNIAEGSSRGSRQDFVRFVEYAAGSVFEVVSQSALGKRQGLLSEAEYQAIYAAAERQSKMLSGLKRRLSVEEQKR